MSSGGRAPRRGDRNWKPLISRILVQLLSYLVCNIHAYAILKEFAKELFLLEKTPHRAVVLVVLGEPLNWGLGSHFENRSTIFTIINNNLDSLSEITKSYRD